MNWSSPPERERLTSDEVRRVEHACDRFEAACKAIAPGKPRQRIEDYLGDIQGPEREALLCGLLDLELTYFGSARPPLAEYLARFPEHRTIVNQVWEEVVEPEAVAADTSVRSANGSASNSELPPSPCVPLNCRPGAELSTAESGASPTPLSGPSSVAERGESLPAVPGYEVLGVLGRGGMGVVYKARQVRPNRLVALKMIVAIYPSAEHLARFRKEAEAVARLAHPNIVQIFEVGEHEGKPFFSLELCPGGSLDKKFKDTTLPPREAAQQLETLARTMQAAHDKGVIHRDLKPANVLLADDGTPKITDFGLAKILDDPGPTRMGERMGTPRYMAPEQAKGETEKVGPLADVYALGAILYESITGRPPFQGADVSAILHQVCNTEVLPPSRLTPGLSRELEAICLKCLEKEPARRYASPKELADDLRLWLDGRPTKARPVGPFGRAVRWCKREPRLAVAGATVMLSLMAVATLFGVIAQQEAANAGEQARLREDANQKASEAKADRDFAKEQLYFSQIGQAQREIELHNCLAASQVLNKTASERRGWEYHVLRRLCDGTPLTLYGHTRKVNAVAFSPDGAWIAAASDDGTVRIWNAQTGSELRALRGHDKRVAAVAFNHDGSRLASAADDRTVKIWDAQTGDMVRTLCEHESPVTAVAFSPNGNRLASAAFDGTVRIWDARARAVAPPLRGHAGPVRMVTFSPDGARLASTSDDRMVKIWETRSGSAVLTLQQPGDAVAFSPDGSHIAFASREGPVKFWDIQRGKEVHESPGHVSGVTRLAYSPDGVWIASASPDQTVRVWNARNGKLARSLLGHKGLVTAVVYSPDGDRIASASHDGTVKIWGARGEADTLAPHILRARGGNAEAVAFSPTGGHLAAGYYDQTVKVWDVQTGAIVRSLRGHTNQVSGVAYSPNGTHIASASHDGTVKIWDAKTWKEIQTLRGHTDKVTAVAFSPDGTFLASASNDMTLKIWAPPNWEPRHLGRHESGGGSNMVSAVAFSLDGKCLASASHYGTVIVWDLKTATHSAPLEHPQPVTAVAFSPDGKHLASACYDGTVRLWDAQSRKEVFTLPGHISHATAVGFSPDGARLASTSSDGTVKIWDARLGCEGLTLHRQKNGSAVAFSRDGYLALASYDGTLLIWDGRKDGYDPWAEDVKRREELAPAWHLEDATKAVRAGDWFAAAFHLGRLIRLRPDERAFYSRRANAYWQLNRPW